MNTGPPYAPRWARLTRKRLAPLDPAAAAPARGLSKSLTRLDLLVIGVAQIIRAGIFIISGVGIKIAGPGIILSFLVAGLACTLAVCLGVLVLPFTAPTLPAPFAAPAAKPGLWPGPSCAWASCSPCQPPPGGAWDCGSYGPGRLCPLYLYSSRQRSNST